MLSALVVYGLLALFANWPAWPGDPSRIRPGDLSLDTWMLAWTPHAILHGQNIFATNYVNYPVGVNLAQNTSMPLLGALTGPLTLLVSPVASVNLLLWLAPTLSAGAMFFVLKRWTGKVPAAFVGGLLYGFSPYVVSQEVNHLNLAFVPLPPLILYFATEVYRTGSRRAALLLALSLTAQVYVTAEIAATTLIVGGVAAVVFGVRHPREVILSLRRALPALVIAGVTTAIGSSAYVIAITHGAYRAPGEVPWIGGRQADLLSPVVPTHLQMFGPSSAQTTGDNLVQGYLSENDAYVGIPLLLLLVGLAFTCRRRRGVVPSFAMVVCCEILSFGTYVKVNNHVTHVALPDKLLLHTKLLQELIPVRFSLYAFLFGAVVVALGIATLEDRLRERPPRRALPIAYGVVGAAAAVFLVPAWPQTPEPTGVPSYFTSAAVRRIPSGAVVFMAPYASSVEPGVSIYQALAGFRYRVLGGYGMFDDAGGYPDTNPAHLEPLDVIQYVTAKDTGGGVFLPGPVPELDAQLVCDTRTFLRLHAVDVVLATDVGVAPAEVQRLFVDALGAPSATTGGVKAWYDVTQRLAGSAPAGVTC